MKVAVQWSGGKTSSLACYKAIKAGHKVTRIVTFLTEKTPSTHTLELLRLQSEALGIPYLWDKLEAPYPEAYREAVTTLKKDHGIEAIVTGDTTFAPSLHSSWLDAACKEAGIKVLKPLWGVERTQIFKELLSGGFKVVFTSVKAPCFSEEWLGRALSKQSLQELQAIDTCGEIEAYHTTTLDAPLFKHAIEISDYTMEKDGSTYILEPISMCLKN